MNNIQTKLNGYYYNTADLLNMITGKVELAKLEEATAWYTDQCMLAGATDEQVKKAMFRTCNLFDITV